MERDREESWSIAATEQASPSPQSADTRFPVVGIGASAGGLEALLPFFDRLPSDTGVAFVVVLHLSSDRASQAAAVLQRHSVMPVQEVARRVAPPQVIGNADDDVVYLSEGSDRFLQLDEGEPSTNLLRMAHPDLRLELRAVTMAARQQRRRATSQRVRMAVDDTLHFVDLQAELIEDGRWPSGYLFIVFVLGAPEVGSTDNRPAPAASADAGMTAEQQQMRGQLQLDDRGV
jgi:hypothetical protein